MAPKILFQEVSPPGGVLFQFLCSPETERSLVAIHPNPGFRVVPLGVNRILLGVRGDLLWQLDMRIAYEITERRMHTIAAQIRILSRLAQERHPLYPIRDALGCCTEVVAQDTET